MEENERIIPDWLFPEFDGLEPVRERGRNASFGFDVNMPRQRTKVVKPGDIPISTPPLNGGDELETILKDATAFKRLYAYCKSEFSSENLEFIALVRYLNPETGANGGEYLVNEFITANQNLLDPKKLMVWLFNNYVSTAAPTQANIDSERRTYIEVLIKNGALNIKMFNNAYNEVRAVVLRDTLPRFKRQPVPPQPTPVVTPPQRRGFMAKIKAKFS